jgi:hypothetical protein
MDNFAIILVTLFKYWYYCLFRSSLVIVGKGHGLHPQKKRYCSHIAMSFFVDFKIYLL